MNTTTTIRRRIAFCTIAAFAFPAFAACGTEIAPPAQDIGGSQQKHGKAPAQPARTSIPRGGFGDEYGQAKARKQQSTPAGSGTRNRIDFRDRGF